MGLSGALKAGIERLSGHDMNDVKVHHNSSRPAQLHARAYARGADIYIAPGEQRHLPHEAWHVVQQKQGRVGITAHLSNVAVNDDPALESEADVMGARAAAMGSDLNGERTVGVANSSGARRPVVQGVFDWLINAAHNRRKVGVEITEDNGGGNGIAELNPTAAWAALAGPAQAALWTHTVNLHNAADGAQVWQVAVANTMMPTYFATTAGNKREWMKWGSVLLTEDYGDFEWIVRHPSDVQGVTYYRDELANVNAARQTFRGALAALGAGNQFVLALNNNPALGEVFYVNLQATNDASSQITFESTDRGKTKQALLEGMTHGLNKRQVPNRASLVDPDAAIAATVTTAAGRVAVANVDRELIMAYLIGDMTHKMATLISGAGWAGAIAANFKQWRTLFPKSHPSQIMFQAMDDLPTLTNINALRVAINAQSAAIIGDVTDLFAQKLHDQTINVEWNPGTPLAPGAFTAASDPAGAIFNAVTTGTYPVGGKPALQAALVGFCAANGVVLATEFTNALTALTDSTAGPAAVVRSTGFATHGGSNKGFAFEDRAEVATQFPGLASTYSRVQAVVDRY